MDFTCDFSPPRSPSPAIDWESEEEKSQAVPSEVQQSSPVFRKRRRPLFSQSQPSPVIRGKRRLLEAAGNDEREATEAGREASDEGAREELVERSRRDLSCSLLGSCWIAGVEVPGEQSSGSIASWGEVRQAPGYWLL